LFQEERLERAIHVVGGPERNTKLALNNFGQKTACFITLVDAEIAHVFNNETPYVCGFV